MYKRAIEEELHKSAQTNPVVTLVGPRQSGKTTLARSAFPDYAYVSLEDPDVRRLALDDPRGLLRRFSGNAIFDEVQRTPELTSYLQTIVDDPRDERRFVLTGSHNLRLMQAVSQSLAGRTRVLELLPFSAAEISDHEDARRSLNELMWRGGYPAIYDRDLHPHHWLKDYLRLYIERDLRSVIQVTNLDAFERFIRLCAGRSGQLASFSSLANETGVTQPTVSAWFSALKTTFVCFALQPHYRNFNRRVVKTPKLYFYDTGLLCYLLGIGEPQQLDVHPLRGQIFENFVVAELVKAALNAGHEARLFFWRDQKGREVDIVQDDAAGALFATEIKLAETFQPQFTENLAYFNRLQGASPPAAAADAEGKAKAKGVVIYAGEDDFSYQGYAVRSWRSIAEKNSEARPRAAR